MSLKTHRADLPWAKRIISAAERRQAATDVPQDGSLLTAGRRTAEHA
jgi:hypothetical protein